ncbi:MAG: diacylglycerol kinase family protein, partial [Gemmatimonadota bacterium]
MASIPNAEIHECDGPAAIERRVRAAVADGFQRFIAAGGDGTVSEVASVLSGRRGLECGVLPLGTGNDLARALGIAPGLDRALEILRDGSARPIDAILCEADGGIASGRERALMWNAVVGGFGGRISDHLTPERKHRWRRRASLRAALSELRDLSSHEVRIELDGEPHELDLLMLVIANGSRVGGGVPLAPEAKVDDGVLDVIGIRTGSGSDLIRLGPRVLSGRHLDHPGELLERRLHAPETAWRSRSARPHPAKTEFAAGKGCAASWQLGHRPAPLRWRSSGPAPSALHAAAKMPSPSMT